MSAWSLIFDPMRSRVPLAPSLSVYPVLRQPDSRARNSNLNIDGRLFGRLSVRKKYFSIYLYICIILVLSESLKIHSATASVNNLTALVDPIRNTALFVLDPHPEDSHHSKASVGKLGIQ